jgi:hypothetical protein
MAKIFSKIAEKTIGLQQVYNDSTVQLEPLNYIRDTITDTPMSLGIFANDIFRIEKIYNLYATSNDDARNRLHRTSPGRNQPLLVLELELELLELQYVHIYMYGTYLPTYCL